uniref:Uncharacterized protein n=1 Tax=Phocoena sinus TaxID=42100 RepID=A0A8C9AXD5_PHOSS
MHPWFSSSLFPRGSQVTWGGDSPQLSWNETQARGLSEKLLDLFVGISQLILKGRSGASTVVSHKEWGLRFLTCRAQLTRPVACVIMDQLTEIECQEQNVCSWKLRGLQSRSVYNTGWCDVAYM